MVRDCSIKNSHLINNSSYLSLKKWAKLVDLRVIVVLTFSLALALNKLKI